MQGETFDWDGIQVHLAVSSRRTLALQVKEDGSVIARVPRYVSLPEVYAFLSEHEDWMREHIRKVKEREAARPREPRLTREELEALAKEACRDLASRTAHFAPIVGVTYGRITVRNQRTRWGSCSSRGNLNYNCLLMLAPEAVRDYIVVHELCHRKEMNHSPRFWAEVKRVLPDYKEQEAWLKKHGDELMHRMMG